jgi:hypothetical protein
VKDRLIRIGFGSLVLTFIIAIIYGWSYVHVIFGLTSMFYFGAFGIFLGYLLVYAIGDIAMAAYETYKSNEKLKEL